MNGAGATPHALAEPIRDRLREIIAVELQIEKEQIVPAAVLRDLGMDSIAALNILWAVEEAFALEAIDVNEVVKVRTVADVEDLVQQYLVRTGAA